LRNVFLGSGHSGSPRSSHPGGLNGLFADGSVRFVSDFIERSGTYRGTSDDTSDMRAWERINVAADGDTVEEWTIGASSASGLLA
jgi:prepilin-type processing-associated H-X9-DG protein